MATIVLMDDLEDLRKMYVDMFSSLGHRVLDFEDAAPALAEVDFAEVDLVVTDLDMPTNGRTAIRTLRKRGVKAPIIVISGAFKERERAQLLEIGAQIVLRKPVMFHQLLKAAMELLGEAPFAEQRACAG